MTTEANKPTNGATPGPSSPLIQQTQQFAQGFSGMATEPFPEAARRILAETPDPEDVEIKPDGIVFMPGVWWRRQLTRAFGAGGWALAPRGPTRTIGNGVEYHGALYCMGRWVSEAVGGCDSGYMTHDSMVESARTDCLSKCCKDLGMASELWSKAWREAWQEDFAETYKDEKTGKQRWKLRDKREPKKANLMRDVPTPTAPAPESSAPAAVPSADQTSLPLAAKESSPSTPPSDPTVDPLMLNARKAVRDQFKRLKFTGTEAKRWLSTKFGVDAIPKLDEEQIDNCHALLACLGTDDKEPPAKYLSMIDNLRSNGKILKEAR